ncbi:Spo0B domain-containing protein [Oceanobacillus sp. CAU 1775]
MKSHDVVKVLQQYRHDILNHVQLIHGYISLRDVEKADISLTNLLEYFQNERDLLNLNMPNTYLWFLQFPKYYNRFKVTYAIDIKKNLQHADNNVVEKLNVIMQEMLVITNPKNLYSIEIEFMDNIETCKVIVYLKLDSHKVEEELLAKFEKIERTIESGEIIYHFHIPINNEVN